jgi:hypothetical protein
MMFNCRRCGERGELHKGKITGNNVAKYRQHETEINSTTILKIEGTSLRRRLCPSCLEELAIWIANKKAHVRVPSAAKPVVNADPKPTVRVGPQ